MSPDGLFTDEELDELADRIDRWAEAELADNPMVLAVDTAERGRERLWFIRMAGEDRDVTTVWLILHQRTLKYETFVLPEPEENQLRFYEYLMRHNYDFVGARFSIGPENAVFLNGELPLRAFDESELDRIIGTCWAYVERCFRTALGIGFESRVRPRG